MGNIDVWTSTRASPDDAFETPVDVGAVSSSSKDIPYRIRRTDAACTYTVIETADYPMST